MSVRARSQSRWQARRGASPTQFAKRQPRLSLSDIAIGLNLGATAVLGEAAAAILGRGIPSAGLLAADQLSSMAVNEDEAARQACLRGQMAACARATWMRSPGAEALTVLALVDCEPLCASLIDLKKNSSASHSSVLTSADASSHAPSHARHERQHTLHGGRTRSSRGATRVESASSSSSARFVRGAFASPGADVPEARRRVRLEPTHSHICLLTTRLRCIRLAIIHVGPDVLRGIATIRPQHQLNTSSMFSHT